MNPDDILAFGNEPSELGSTVVFFNTTTVPQAGTSPYLFNIFDPSMTRMSIRQNDLWTINNIGSLYGESGLYESGRGLRAVFEETNEAYISFRNVNITIPGNNSVYVNLILSEGNRQDNIQYAFGLSPHTGEFVVYRRNPSSPTSLGMVVIPPVSAQTQASKDMIMALFNAANGGALAPMGERMQNGFSAIIPQVIFRVKTGTIGTVSLWVHGALVYTGEYDLSWFPNGFSYARVQPLAKSTSNTSVSELIVSKSNPNGLRVRTIAAASAGASHQGTGGIPNAIDATSAIYEHQDNNDLSLWTQSGVPGGYVPVVVDQTMVVSRETTPAYGVDMPLVRNVTWIDSTLYNGGDVTIGTERRVVRNRMKTSPATGTTWTASEVNGMQVGLRSIIPGS